MISPKKQKHFISCNESENRVSKINRRKIFS